MRFTKGKTVNPWVAVAVDLPDDYTPSEEHKRLAIVDVLLATTTTGEELFDDMKATCALVWGFEGKIDDLMNAFANEKDEDVILEGQELVDTPAPKRAEVIRRVRLVSQLRRTAAVVFFNSITTARGTDMHSSSLVAVGGGGLSSAVVCHAASSPSFWWNGWLILIHVFLVVLAVVAVLKAARALKEWFKGDVQICGGGGLPPAVADAGTQCEIVHLDGLTVQGLQEECRRAGLRTNGLRAELVARVDHELRRRAN